MVTIRSIDRETDYPTSDGKPMAETDLHRQIMMDLITTLQDRYEDDPMVYVSGDLLLFYERGNKRKHVAPDVFVVFGVAKRPRLNYLLWQEGKGPDVIIEVTSKTTRREDQTKKRTLYRDVLKVPEYFQFDPTEDYLRPSLQGYRLVDDEYQPIEPEAGRLPSNVLGLHLERDGVALRLFDPQRNRWLPTRREALAEAELARQRAEIEAARTQLALERAELGRERAELEVVRLELARQQAESEIARLRRELEALRRRLGPESES